MRVPPTSLAITRAGAMAVVAGNRGLRRAWPLTVRLVLLVGGAVTIGVGAGATMASGLGPGPFDVLVSGIALQTGLSFALSLWVFAGFLALAAASMGNRPGLGTAVAPLIIGPVVQISAGLMGAWLPLGHRPAGSMLALDRPPEVALAAAVHLAGILMIGVGAGALISSGLGAGTGDLVAAATSSKLGRSVPLVRTALELSWIGLGLMLGGPAGVGTILVAVTIGHSVSIGHDRVDAVVTRVLGRPLSGPGPDGPPGRHAHLAGGRVLSPVDGC